MPRTARKESSTGLYHVIIRGNNRSWIFQKNYYKKVMIKLMMKQEKERIFELYGWCIMDNHAHMIVKTTKEKLGKAMWNINRIFARVYNYKENAVGHVFESRYRSEPIESEDYFLRVIRYVHMNPIKVNIVTEPESYGWSSYKSYIEGKMCNKKINIICTYFGGDLQRFQEFHLKFEELEILDIREDIMKDRVEKAQLVISKYLKNHCIENISELNHTIENRDEIVRELLINSKLSLKKIAELVGTSYTSVHRVRIKSKE